MEQPALKRLFVAFEGANAQWRRTMGLGVNEFLVLFHLWMRETPVTMGEMGRLVNITSGGLTAVVERLEKSDFVSRSADATDRRRTILQLTDKGGDARTAFLELIHEAEAAAEALPEGERVAVEQYLVHVADALERLADEG